MKPLYGLCDSGDRWHHTLRHHHVNDLQMDSLTTDSSLYYRAIGDRLLGLSGTYVNDLLRCGMNDFFHICEETGRVFDSTPETRKRAKFAGISISQEDDGIYSDMQEYTEKLRLPELSDQTWKTFQSFRAKLAWLIYCRPDICAMVAKSAQVTEKQFQENPRSNFKLLEDTLGRLTKIKYRLKYPKLDIDSLFIRIYADASFGTNSDGSSQLGFFLVLMDKYDRFAIISFRSGKCYRVTHSAMAAETIAFAEGFDAAYSLQHALGKLLKRKIGIQMLTDSQQLFDAISKSTRTKEKRLMIDISAAKQSFERFEISDLGLVRTGNMLADCLTKIMQPQQLMQAIETGKLEHEIEKWVIRDYKHDDDP